MEQFLGGSGKRWSVDLVDRIGDASGMGQVFRGYGEGGERVAVKRVVLFDNSLEAQQHRQREIEVLSLLENSNFEHIMKTLDIGYESDVLYIVMPEADKSLNQSIQAMEIGDDEKLQALREVAEGLKELEQVRILHRDLKPSNVLYHDGKWKLADFGISRSLEESTATFTFTGAGTPIYMAPEIWRGEPASIKSDLYSYGVLAYETVTGTPPFVARDIAALRHMHLTEVAPAIENPRRLSRLIARLLTKDPALRPQDASALLASLEVETRPNGPALDRLLEAKTSFSHKESLESALREKFRLEQEEAQAIASQGEADLREIIELAVEQVVQLDEKACLFDNGFEIGITTGEASLTVTLTRTQRPFEFQGKAVFWLGVFVCTAHDAPSRSRSRSQTVGPIANAIFAEVGGRWEWQIVRIGQRGLSRIGGLVVSDEARRSEL